MRCAIGCDVNVAQQPYPRKKRVSGVLRVRNHPKTATAPSLRARQALGHEARHAAAGDGYHLPDRLPAEPGQIDADGPAVPVGSDHAPFLDSTGAARQFSAALATE